MDFLSPRLRETYRILEPTGSFFLHIDYREAHYCKVLLDEIFGRASFMNEIIWAYDYGARSKRKWSSKHDTIFWYAKDPNAYTFNFDVMDPLHGSGTGRQGKGRSGQDSHRCVVAHHREPKRARKDRIPDPEAPGDPGAHRQGSLQPRRHGTGLLRREWHDGRSRSTPRGDYILVDSNPEAARVMAVRLADYDVEAIGFDGEHSEALQQGVGIPVSHWLCGP